MPFRPHRRGPDGQGGVQNCSWDEDRRADGRGLPDSSGDITHIQPSRRQPRQTSHTLVWTATFPPSLFLESLWKSALPKPSELPTWAEF